MSADVLGIFVDKSGAALITDGDGIPGFEFIGEFSPKHYTTPNLIAIPDKYRAMTKQLMGEA